MKRTAEWLAAYLAVGVFAGGLIMAMPVPIQTKVPCEDPALAITNSNIQVDVWGTVAGVEVHRYGIVRRTGPTTWVVLSDDHHVPAGLGPVICNASGSLTTMFDPMDTLGSWQLGPDEKYTGRFAFGASAPATKDRLIVTITTTGTP